MSTDPLDNLSIPPTPENAAELADLYAIGALSREEVAAFEKQVAAGQPAFVAEFKRVQPVMEALLSTIEPLAPPPALRNVLAHEFGVSPQAEPPEVRELVAASPAGRREAQGIRLVRAGASAALAANNLRAEQLTLASGRWHPTLVRGVRFRALSASRRHNRRAILLHMGPGTELPEHGHTGTEEIIMLSGDLDLAGTTLGPTDYISISPSADHGVPRTTHGCMCVVVSGYQPFPLRSWVRMGWSVVRSWFGGKSK